MNTPADTPADTCANPLETVPAERRALLERARRVASTPGARLLLTGEPGIGKTTLLEAVVGAARGHGSRVMHVRASDADARRPFHGLVDLLREVEDERLERLPAVQRLAVEVVLARQDATRDLSPMTLHVAVAALVDDLLTTEGAVLVVVDDWPWLDAETGAVLRYVLTRPAPRSQRVSLLASQRRLRGVVLEHLEAVDARVFEPADVVEVPALTPGGLQEVVSVRTGEVPPAADLAAVHRASGGNPLWAMEVLAELGSAPAGWPTEETRVPRSIAGVFGARVRSLPAPVLDVLVVTAAAGDADPATVADLVSGGARAVVTALEQRIVHLVDERLRPAHPVLGSAALEHLGAWRRLDLHRRLAEVATSATERAHHLDLAAPPGPDESAAAALAAAVTESRARGAQSTALQLAERAVTRSARGAAARPARVVALAETAFAAGRFERVVQVLTGQDEADLDLAQFDRAVPLLLDALTFSDRGERAVAEVLDALTARAAADPLRSAVLAAYRAELASIPVAQRRACAERAIGELSARPVAPVALHRATASLVLARLDAGEGLDVELLARSAQMEEHLVLVAPNDSAQAQRGFYAYLVDDLEGSRAALTELREQARATGEEAMGIVFDLHLAMVDLFAGHPVRAAELIAEVASAEPWASHPPPALVRAQGLLALTRDDGAEVRRLVGLASGAGGDNPGQLVRAALPGLRAARAEDWAAAVGPLLQARAIAESIGVREPGRRMWLDVELGESLVALDRREEAGEVAAWFGEVAAAGHRPLAGGQELRLRGLLAATNQQLAEAERLLTASVDVLRSAGYPLEHARSLLELGRVLRRRRARSRARAALEEARQITVRIADVPLRTRVERELSGPSKTGEGQVLTPAELAVARAAAAGASNREIAAAQFVSVRTVEAHLSQSFRKLNVRSRTQLAARMREEETGSTRRGEGRAHHGPASGGHVRRELGGYHDA